jgi:hypothetical protein
MPFAWPFVTVSQEVYRAIPDDPANDPLDPSFAARSDDNRWNVRGEPTLYLAGDTRVLAAEWARHVQIVLMSPELARHARHRRLFAIQAIIDLVIDLRDANVLDHLHIRDSPVSFLRDRSAGTARSHDSASLSTRAVGDGPFYGQAADVSESVPVIRASDCDAARRDLTRTAGVWH